MRGAEQEIRRNNRPIFCRNCNEPIPVGKGIVLESSMYYQKDMYCLCDDCAKKTIEKLKEILEVK